jgi:cytosine deaminase
MDPWYSMGSADMLEVGHMAIHVAQMGGIEDKKRIFDALTVNSARTMGLEGYGVMIGAKADLVVLQAADVVEALRLKPNRLFVLKSGKVIARTAPRIGELFLDRRPKVIDGGRDFRPAS